jgi:hypothetical protein
LEKWGLEIYDVYIVGRKMFEKGNENEESNDCIDGCMPCVRRLNVVQL